MSDTLDLARLEKLLRERDGQNFDGEVHLTSAEAQRIIAALSRISELESTLRQAKAVRPDNWDDDDDPEQVAAWKAVDDVLGEKA